jgi:tRNA pseudouridine55 synthase
MGHLLDGILLIDKKAGVTSYEVVRKVKTAFRTRERMKVGHAGTLDAPAAGLLIVLLGQGTKLFPYIVSQPKRYLATMTLGVETDTLDFTGEVLHTGAVPALDEEVIRGISRKFVGEIEQTPPAFSAVKVGGIRAHRLARKGLTTVLKARKVKVHALTILSAALPDITMEVVCSGGTYIRALVSDMGRAIGPGACLKALRRLAIGSFSADQGLPSDRISDPSAALEKRVISLRGALPDMPEVPVGKELAGFIRNGRQPEGSALKRLLAADIGASGRAKIVEKDSLVAIAQVEKGEEVDHGNVRMERVFV